MFLLRALLLLSLVALGMSEKTGISPRMPMHRTDGIFDLLPTGKFLRKIGKALGKLFAQPLKLLKKSLKQFGRTARTMWSLVGRGTTVPGMTPMGGRSSKQSPELLSEESIDRFFKYFGV